MNFEDFTGFIIAILAMVYFVYQSYSARAAKENADENPEEQSEVKQLLRSLNIDVNEEVAERPYRQPPPKLKRIEEQLNQLPSKPNYVEPPIRRPKEVVASTGHGLGSITDSTYMHEYSAEALVLPSVIPLDFSLNTEPSRGKVIIKNLISRNDLIVIHEIMDPPKGLW